MASFAERFQQALVLRNMKQSEVAEITKIGKSSISTYLSGEYEPKQRNVYKIAKALRVSESWLMGYDVPIEPKLENQINILPYVRGRRIPVLGAIHAGTPVLAVENVVGYDYADVPKEDEYFFLNVTGDSMVNAGICDKDVVLVKMQNVAENGDIVVCLINGDEATLKKFHTQGNIVVLQPENSAYQPIIVPCSDFDSGYARIVGVVTEARKKFK